MEITLEMIDAVRERSGASYEDARNALEQSNGSVVDALVFLENRSSAKTQETLGRIKALVKEGKVNKIRLKRGEQVLLTVPVNVGIVGGLVGLAAAPWWGVRRLRLRPTALIADSRSSRKTAAAPTCCKKIARRRGHAWRRSPPRRGRRCSTAPCHD